MRAISKNLGLLPVLLLTLAAGCRTPKPGDAQGAQAGPEINVPIPAEASATDRRRLQSLLDQIAQEVGEAKAATAAQCRTLALGSKPCGGPWTYVVYSASAADTTRLQRLAAEFNAEQDRVNQALGLASTCDMLLEPEVELGAGGVCQARTR
jgi:hypothetical protein